MITFVLTKCCRLILYSPHLEYANSDGVLAVPLLMQVVQFTCQIAAVYVSRCIIGMPHSVAHSADCWLMFSSYTWILWCCRIAFGAAVAEPARAARDEEVKPDRPVFSGISAKLMSSMGYKEGIAPAKPVASLLVHNHVRQYMHWHMFVVKQRWYNNPHACLPHR